MTTNMRPIDQLRILQSRITKGAAAFRSKREVKALREDHIKPIIDHPAGYDQETVDLASLLRAQVLSLLRKNDLPETHDSTPPPSLEPESSSGRVEVELLEESDLEDRDATRVHVPVRNAWEEIAGKAVTAMGEASADPDQALGVVNDLINRGSELLTQLQAEGQARFDALLRQQFPAQAAEIEKQVASLTGQWTQINETLAALDSERGELEKEKKYLTEGIQKDQDRFERAKSDGIKASIAVQISTKEGFIEEHAARVAEIGIETAKLATAKAQIKVDAEKAANFSNDTRAKLTREATDLGGKLTAAEAMLRESILKQTPVPPPPKDLEAKKAASVPSVSTPPLKADPGNLAASFKGLKQALSSLPGEQIVTPSIIVKISAVLGLLPELKALPGQLRAKLASQPISALELIVQIDDLLLPHATMVGNTNAANAYTGWASK